MALQVINRLLSRSGGTGINAGDEVPMQADNLRNGLVADGGGKYTEMARAGGVWNVMNAAHTPLVVFPSTLAKLEIYNNLSSGMTMEILELTVFELLGTAAVHNVSVWAMVTAPKAAPSTATLVVGSQSGRAPYTDTASTRVTTGAGTTVVANGWRPFGPPNPAATQTATPGMAWSVRVDGQLIVPPGCSLCIASVDSLATASSVQVGAVWNERVGMTVVS